MKSESVVSDSENSEKNQVMENDPIVLDTFNLWDYLEIIIDFLESGEEPHEKIIEKLGRGDSDSHSTATGASGSHSESLSHLHAAASSLHSGYLPLRFAIYFNWIDKIPFPIL